MLLALYELKRKGCFNEYNEINKGGKNFPEIQKKYLEKLLNYAYKNVEYYRFHLKKAEIDAENFVNVSYLSRMPLLTKKDIRLQNGKLASTNLGKNWYYNTSGGSTGEPVKFIQDLTYNKWLDATFRYYYDNILGIDELATKKILIWGSPRDILSGSIGLKAKTFNFLSNTMWFNSYRMSSTDLENYVKKINRYKPNLIRGYASSLYELCKFIDNKKIYVYSPKIIISSAESLRPAMRETVERVFGTKVYDFYGSREVGSIAGECKYGLIHIFSFNNYLELLDNVGNEVSEGSMGKVVITNLHNYSMPLIRYEVGDTAMCGPKKCKCGNPLPTLKQITGRIYDHFVKEDGSIIYGGFFTQLFYSKNWIRAFQIVQEDYDKIKIYAVSQKVNHSEKANIENSIKFVMGQNCKIYWDFVDEIPKTPQGKHLYTKSLVR